MQMIIGMAQENRPSQGDGDETEDAPAMLSAVGRYLVTDTEDKNCEVRFVTYQEDGTILVNDTPVACQVDSLGETYCRLSVTEHETYGSLNFGRNDNGFYSGSLYDQDGKWICNFIRTDHKPDQAAITDVAATWYAYSNNDKQFYDLTLSDDFTAKLYGNTYRWTVSSYSNDSEQDWLYLRLYNDDGYAYSATIDYNKQSDILSMQVSDRKGEHNVRYFKESLMPYLNGFSYYPFDRWNASSFTLYQGGSISMNDMEYWKLESADKATVNGQIFADDEATDPSYTFTLTLEGDYPQLVLKDLATNTETIYYNNHFQYDTKNPEYIYQETRHHLEECLEGHSTRPEGYENYISGNEYLKYIYASFSQVKGYQDVDTYLSRFTIQRDKLQTVKNSYADAFGNIHESTCLTYTYLKNGAQDVIDVSSFSDGNKWILPLPLTSLGIAINTYDDWQIVYQEDGKIQELLHYSGDAIRMRAVPTYDGSGRIVSMTVTNSQNNHYTTQMTYDANGRLVRIESSDFDFDVSGDYTVTFTFTYNSDGTVAKFVYFRDAKSEFWNDYEESIEYRYQSGKLVSARYRQARINEQYPSDNSVMIDMEYTFSYNDKGNVTEAAYVYHTEHNYTDYKLTYFYNDFYFYDAE